MKNRARILALLLAATTAITYMPAVTATAQDTQAVETQKPSADDAQTAKTAQSSTDDENPATDEVFNTYAAYVFGLNRGGTGAPGPKRASWGVGRLSADEKTLYDSLITQLQGIIDKGGSTEVTLDMTKLSQTYNADYDVSALAEKLYRYVYFNHPELVCYGITNSYHSEATTQGNKLISFTISIPVDTNYRLDGDEYSLNNTKLLQIQKAKKNADDLIANTAKTVANDNMAVYNTVKAYADWIAAHNTYNDAAGSSDDENFDPDYIEKDAMPWSLVYVFDDNSSTNVVCEGYSKAFQYLMDNTKSEAFTQHKVGSKIVTSAGHMWNVVTIDGINYILDVTWYDSDSETEPNRTEFLLGSKGYEDETDAHVYEDMTTRFYTTEELNLSETPYDPARTALKAPEGIKLSGTYGDSLADFTVSDEDNYALDGETRVAGTWQIDDAFNPYATALDKTFLEEHKSKVRITFVPDDDADKYNSPTVEADVVFSKKDITVEIKNRVIYVGDELDLTSEDAWDLADSDEEESENYLAEGDDRSDLGVTLKASVEDTSTATDDAKITGTSVSDYYNVTFTPADGATLKIEATDKKKPTVEENPSITITYGDKLDEGSVLTGRAVDGDKAVSGTFQLDEKSINKYADTYLGVGTYEATAAFIPSDEAYREVANIPVTITVQKKPINVTILDAEKYVGEENPDLYFKVTPEDIVGYEDGGYLYDTPDDLDIVLSTTADKDSPAGPYPITGTSDSENYDVTFIKNGVLTVKEKETPATPTDPSTDPSGPSSPSDPTPTNPSGGSGSTGGGSSSGVVNPSSPSGNGGAKVDPTTPETPVALTDAEDKGLDDAKKNPGTVIEQKAVDTDGVSYTVRTQTVGDSTVSVVTKDSDGYATVDVYADAGTGDDGVAVKLSADALASIKALDGNRDSVITLHAGNDTAKADVTLNTADLSADALYLYEKDAAGNYVMVEKPETAVTDLSAGKLTVTAGKTYDLVNADQAKTIDKEIKAAVKADKKTFSLKKNKTRRIRVATSASVKSVSYRSSRKKAVKVSKKGNVRILKKGRATVKVTVVFNDGSKKYINIRVTGK